LGKSALLDAAEDRPGVGEFLAVDGDSGIRDIRVDQACPQTPHLILVGGAQLGGSLGCTGSLGCNHSPLFKEPLFQDRPELVPYLGADLELIDPLPDRNHADSLEVLDGSLGDVEDVSQGGAFHSRVSLMDGWGDTFADRLQFIHRQGDRSLVRLIESHSLRQIRDDFRDDDSLSQREPHREMPVLSILL
jgi:hypothetical protein